ncbi:hypothetical protein B0H14DRAFT_2568736 [Mycena olivaceomarginata]|nr:hypothetical protein B0H14DRAFT_2568736 [Mycena olivaceomarginata]
MNQHWILSFVRLFLATTGTADIGETIRYSANPSEPTQLGRSTLTVISVLIGDRVIGSSVGFLLSVKTSSLTISPPACGLTVAALFSRSSVNFLVSAKGRITTNWVLTVMEYFLTISIEAPMYDIQVWRLDRPVEGMEAGPLMSGTAVLVESTAITTAHTVDSRTREHCDVSAYRARVGPPARRFGRADDEHPVHGTAKYLSRRAMHIGEHLARVPITEEWID